MAVASDEVEAMEARLEDRAVEVRLFGRFVVVIGGRVVDGAAFASTRAAQLVQLLALAEGFALTRDQVIEALWPHLGVAAGAANLRKAAHHARRALDATDAIVLRRGLVALFPGRLLDTDANRFLRAADAALASDDSDAWRVPAELYTSDLLSESLYEEWTQGPRRVARTRFIEVLRHGRQWERLAELEPTDEPAHCELMRAAMAAGNRHAAVRWYGRLRTALLRDVGMLPDRETDALYDECVAGMGAMPPAFVGRRLELARAAAVIANREAPVSLVVVRGPAGIGKSTFCDELANIATRNGLQVAATRVEAGSTPYAVVASLVRELMARRGGFIDEVGPGVRSVLSELASPPGVDGATRSLTRQQVTGAVCSILEQVRQDNGVAMVVDDADLADEAAIDVLMQLATAATPRTVVVFAYRAERASVATRPCRRVDGATRARAVGRSRRAPRR